MKTFIRNNITSIILSVIGTIALMIMLGFDRPKGTVGVEIFFPFLLILYWICKYIETKGE